MGSVPVQFFFEFPHLFLGNDSILHKVLTTPDLVHSTTNGTDIVFGTGMQFPHLTVSSFPTYAINCWILLRGLLPQDWTKSCGILCLSRNDFGNELRVFLSRNMKTFHFLSFSFFTSFSTAARISHSESPQIVSNIPGTVVNATSVAQFTTEKYGFDGPKVSPLNVSAVDWWYFDVVSADAKSAVVIVFQMQAAIIGDGVHQLAVDVDATFPNGTTVSARAVASSAVVTTVGQGSSGVYAGTGMNWAGTPDLSLYTITLDSPELGVTGKVTFKSVS
jgi:hypothetical protein